MVRARRRGLDDRAIAALSAASVIGRSFDLQVVALVTGEESDDLLDAMERAEGLALVSEAPDVPGRLRFRHSLVQQAFYQDLGLTRRRNLHLRIADAMDRLGSDRGAEIVRARPAPGRGWSAGGSRPPNGRVPTPAGEHALELLAPDEAARWFRRASRWRRVRRSTRQPAHCCSGWG